MAKKPKSLNDGLASHLHGLETQNVKFLGHPSKSKLEMVAEKPKNP